MEAESAKFAAGDRVELDTPDGRPMRAGTVVDVVVGGGHLHGYRIEWDDGHVGLFSPSARGLRRAVGDDVTAGRA